MSETYTRRYEHTLTVDFVVAEATDIGAAIDALWGPVVQALAADYTLGGAVFDVDEGVLGNVEMLEDEGGPVQAAASCDFVLHYATAEGDPYTSG